MTCARLPKLVLLSIALLGAGAWWSNAQDRQRPSGGGHSGGFGRFGRVDTITLIGSKQVEEELKVTQQQKEKISKAVEAVRSEMRRLTAGLRELPHQEREVKLARIREKREQLNSEARKEIETALSDDQVERLGQISLQMRGVRALADDDLSRKLEMSNDQQNIIKAVLGEQEKRQRELFQNMSNLPRGERGQLFAKIREMRTESESRALAVLTQEQQSAFNELKGAKFEIDRRSLFGGFGGSSGRRGAESETRVRPPAEP